MRTLRLLELEQLRALGSVPAGAIFFEFGAAGVFHAILSCADVWASAQTGSGKTAAFLLPLLERLARDPAPSPSAKSRRSWKTRSGGASTSASGESRSGENP